MPGRAPSSLAGSLASRAIGQRHEIGGRAAAAQAPGEAGAADRLGQPADHGLFDDDRRGGRAPGGDVLVQHRRQQFTERADRLAEPSTLAEELAAGGAGVVGDGGEIAQHLAPAARPRPRAGRTAARWSRRWSWDRPGAARRRTSSFWRGRRLPPADWRSSWLEMSSLAHEVLPGWIHRQGYAGGVGGQCWGCGVRGARAVLRALAPHPRRRL